MLLGGGSPNGWKTKWTNPPPNAQRTNHYPIILGGYRLPGGPVDVPNWTYAGVGVAAGYVPASPEDIQQARSQSTTLPPNGLARVICVTVNFVIPDRVIQAPDQATQQTQPVTPGQTRYTVVPGDTLSGIARRFKVSGEDFDSLRSSLNDTEPAAP